MPPARFASADGGCCPPALEFRRGPSRAAIPLRQTVDKFRKRGAARRRDDFDLRDP